MKKNIKFCLILFILSVGIFASKGVNAEGNDSIREQANPNLRAHVGYVVNNWMQSKNSRTGVWGSAKLNITYKNLSVPNGYQENGTSAARRPNTDVGKLHGYLVTQLYRVW